jgi:hypothetical protein
MLFDMHVPRMICMFRAPFFVITEGLLMSQFRFARLALMLAAIGLNAAPALMHSASAQNKDAAAAAAPADTVRPELYKLLDPAQIKPLVDAKNYTELQNRVTQAEAVANRTPYENYVLNRTKLTLASGLKDQKMLQNALEGIIASGKLPATDAPRVNKALADTYYSGKDYAKAIELYKSIQPTATGADKEAVDAALVRSYYFNNDFAQVVTLLAPQLDAQAQAGKTPTLEDLRLYGSAAIKVKDNAAYLKSLELLTSYYPNDNYWSDMIKRGVFQKQGFNEANYADGLRLQFAATKQMDPEYYVDLAELAMKDGFPAEAKKVVDAGFTAGVLNTAAHKQLRDRATKQAADDAKTIASSEAGAAKNKSGAGLVNLGWEYVNMDQFDKGIGFIEQGIAKGGLKSADEAKLRLGMAYARAGNKAKALQTFETVKAGAGLSDIARYYILLLNHPNTGGAATAAN